MLKNCAKISLAVGLALASTTVAADPANCVADFGQMMMVSYPPPPSKSVGGVTITSANLNDVKSMSDVLSLTRSMQKNRETPLFIGTDQEGGLVQRLNKSRGFTMLPSPEKAGTTHDPKTAYGFGQITAEELAAVGINVNFGTDVDVNSNPDNPVIGKLHRSYSKDPDEVAAYGIANVQSYHNARKDGMPVVMPTLKHFPGHGDTATDSHVDFAVVDKTMEQLESTELVPFQKIFSAFPPADQPAVMVGHLSLPKVLSDMTPATLSKKIVTDLLRTKMGFGGLIITDDLSMDAIQKFQPDRTKVAIQAVKAGNDVMLFSSLNQIFASTEEEDELIKNVCVAAKSDKELSQRIAESSERIRKTKKANGLYKSADIPDAPGDAMRIEHELLLKSLGFEASSQGWITTTPSGTLSPVVK